MLCLGKLADDISMAKAMISKSLSDGSAMEVFSRMVSELGGPADFVERVDEYLPCAPFIKPVYAKEKGFINSLDVRALGNLIVDLGGGRRRTGDKIDHAVGLTSIAAIGTEVNPNTPLAIVHARTDSDLQKAGALLKSAFVVRNEKPSPSAVVHERCS